MRDKARAFAIEAHGDQKYGDDPYASHLDAVVAILDEFGHAGAVIAGYLHDVLEDTDATHADLEELFGGHVANAVAFCSDEPGANRKQRKTATYARMRVDIESDAEWVAMAIRAKVADRLANTRASAGNHPRLLAVYRSEMPTFRQSLFVEGICDRMWQELAKLLGEAG